MPERQTFSPALSSVPWKLIESTRNLVTWELTEDREGRSLVLCRG
jgi:hypothetical protein